MADSDGTSLPFERWSVLLWFGSGVVGIVYAALYGMEVFTGTYPAVRGFLGPIMNVLGFAALLGLYPVVVDRRPWLARIGGVCAVLALVGATVGFLAAAGVVSQEVFWVGASQLLFVVGGMSLGFLAFGVASLRSAIHSRTVGLLLLVPVAVMILNLGIVVAGYASPEGRLLVSGLWAVTYLAIGVTLRTDDTAADRPEPTPDATTR